MIAVILFCVMLLVPIEPGTKAKYESLRHAWNGGSNLLPRFNFPCMTEMSSQSMRTTKFVGKQFGRLKVIRRLERDRIECECVCGTVKSFRCDHVFAGKIKSCGCYYHSEEHRAVLSFHGFRTHKPLPDGTGGFHRVLKNYRSNAESRGLEFSLTESQAREMTSANCWYCGSPPRKSTKCSNARVGMQYRYNGIDRKDNSLGYTVENSVTCCYICNRAKWTLPLDVFIGWLDDLAIYRNEKIRQLEQMDLHLPIRVGKVDMPGDGTIGKQTIGERVKP